jgi:hypothetical protein
MTSVALQKNARVKRNRMLCESSSSDINVTTAEHRNICVAKRSNAGPRACFVPLQSPLHQKNQHYIKMSLPPFPASSLSDKSKFDKLGCDATALTTNLMPSLPRRQHAKDKVISFFSVLIILYRERAPAVLEVFLLIRACVSS